MRWSLLSIALPLALSGAVLAAEHSTPNVLSLIADDASPTFGAYGYDSTSRFFVRRLNSGALLLVKHGGLDEKTGREKLRAFVSNDDGATWIGG